MHTDHGHKSGVKYTVHFVMIVSTFMASNKTICDHIEFNITRGIPISVDLVDSIRPRN